MRLINKDHSYRSFWSVLLASATLAFAGCNRGPAIRESSAFDSAPPELKSHWQNALAAARTNGYLAASVTLQTLRGQTNLNEEQLKAVDELYGVVGARMLKAANAGDPDAVKALQAVQASSSRRR